MCVFMNSLPSQSKSAGTAAKKNLALFIRPTPKGEYYKFRLLAFKSPVKNDRDYPFIERYIHQHWGKNDKGKNVVDGQVICPVTKYVKTDGNPYDSCPICKYVNMNWLAYKESGKTDKESSRQAAKYGRKFEAIVPVYVTNDPTYQLNKNHFKVLVFTDSEFYKKFKELINKTSRSACCFNGKNAVDFYIHMTQVPKVVNEGLPTEYTFNQNVIDKFGFTMPDKAYDIPQINKENVDKFPFDETYYVSSTPEELQDFYNKFIKVSNDDIPEEDVEVYNKAEEIKVKPTNSVSETLMTNKNETDDLPKDEDLFDDLTSDPDEEGLEVKTESKPVQTDAEQNNNDISDDELDKLVDGLDELI